MLARISFDKSVQRQGRIYPMFTEVSGDRKQPLANPIHSFYREYFPFISLSTAARCLESVLCDIGV